MKAILRKIADCIIGIALSDLTTAESKIYYLLASKGIVYIGGANGETVIKGPQY